MAHTMRSRRIRCTTVCVAVAFGALLSTVWVSRVAADAVYHTQHLAFLSVGGAPLRSGFVQNIHANGPHIYANERYVLHGATPDTTYQVMLLLYPFDPGCGTEPVELPTATVQTNGSGNGVGHARFSVDAVPEALREATHGVQWELSTGGRVEYATACSAVTLD